MLPYVFIRYIHDIITQTFIEFIERDSPRDQLVVTLFLLTVFGLLLGAGIKSRMEKAGLDTSIAWATSRRWWEVSLVYPFA